MSISMSNPILNRYLRSRLRPKRTLFWVLLVLIITTFIYLLFNLSFVRQNMMSAQEAARFSLFAIMIIQAVLLILLGTGRVASGIVQEKLEGNIDYQRLTPLTPTTKILGYLFGLPAREYLLFLITLPFLIYSIMAGNIPFSNWSLYYLIFFSAVFLYHMTGLMVGMVSNRWWLATLITQGLIFFLYVILPNALSRFGLLFFEYLTIIPAFRSKMVPIIFEKSLATPNQVVERLINQGVPFFTTTISGSLFSLIVQAILMVTFYIMVDRKWRDANAHILGKGYAFFFFVIFQVFLLGNIWPALTGGLTRLAAMAQEYGEIGEKGLAGGIIFFFPCVSIAMAFWLIGIVTPNRHEFTRGIRRMKKLSHKKVLCHKDEASAFPFALFLALIASLVFFIIVFTMIDSGAFAFYQPALMELFHIPIVLALTIFCYYIIVEYVGFGKFMLFVLLFWIVPILAGIIIVIANHDFKELALYIACPSPLVQFVLAATSQLHEDMILEDVITVNRAFWIGVGFSAVIAGTALYKLRRLQSKIRREILA